MEARAARPSPSPRLLALCALLLAAAGITAMFFPAAGSGESPVLARMNEWEVRRGTDGAAGREIALSPGAGADGALLLVSPEHPLPPDYPPPSTRSVSAAVGSYLNADPGAALRQEVIYALCAMEFDFSWSEGAKITEGALSAAQLEERRRDAFRRLSGILPVDEAMAQARLAAPSARESEHRTGYALDVMLLGPLSMSREDPLLRTETGVWLAENMWRYGFIRRYAPESRAEGGCEGIHLRYVGKVHAFAMRALDMELEDYLSLLRREGALTLYRDGEPFAAVYCAPENEKLRIAVPEDGEYTVSSDNAGYTVAAVSWTKAP